MTHKVQEILSWYSSDNPGTLTNLARLNINIFSIPEGYEPVTTMAIGYMGEPQTLPEQFREEELVVRVRKPLETFVFTGNWGTLPLDLSINLKALL